MLEIFIKGINLLNLISFLALFTTGGLFLCGLPICRQIWKHQDTKEISGVPFIMGVVGGSCWWAYGYVKNDQTVICVTSVQVVLYTSYLIFYWIMSKNKYTLKIMPPAIVCITCIFLNVADFAAPLAGIKYVIRNHSTQTLPLPLCIANFLVSTEWFVYGLLKMDFYLILPNGIGSTLALGQLTLFLILPHKTGIQTPLAKFFKYITPFYVKADSSSIDADFGKCVSKEVRKAKNFAAKAIPENISCIIKDQFAYTDVLNDTADSLNISVITKTEKKASETSTNFESPLFVHEGKPKILCRELSTRLKGDIKKLVLVSRSKSEPIVAF
ncbi:unnamed protein product [Thelazia callipaeda]|uniref:Sugar transporter SWEET1 n=1 Tax=Thelazia callipaeda TaxID=103827 RepID=A0A0N5CZY6_THECL|nr:unnamed protein product [Thelazia callipaeda]